MTVDCVKSKITLPDIVIRGRFGTLAISKIELVEATAVHWKALTFVAESSILDDSRRLNPALINMIL